MLASVSESFMRRTKAMRHSDKAIENAMYAAITPSVVAVNRQS